MAFKLFSVFLLTSKWEIYAQTKTSRFVSPFFSEETQAEKCALIKTFFSQPFREGGQRNAFRPLKGSREVETI